MFHSIFYIVSIFIVFLFLLFLSLYLIFSLIANLMGSIYVPTKQKEVDFILKNVNLKKRQIFIDLGSGDGRVVRTAVKLYKVSGVGIEINPLLLLYSKILAKLQKLDDITFKRENLFKTDIKSADIIFVFLMPETLKKLRDKFNNECKKNILIISHGFIIDGYEKYLKKKIDHRPYPTYYYYLKVNET